MPTVDTASNITARTLFLTVKNEKYAYRRFGSGPALPFLLLQHFTGTLDNWDLAVTDPLAQRGEVILFESAGFGRSSCKVPEAVSGMAQHAPAFLDGLGLEICDVLGFSLGGMVAQQMVPDRPSIFRRMILVGRLPEGARTSCTWRNPASRSLCKIQASKVTASCRRSSSLQLQRARPRAKPLSIG